MPTYEFHCAACGDDFEETRPIDHRADPALCRCGALAIREIRTPALGQPDIRPYRALAGDRAGQMIGSRREHREYLKRNHLAEAGDVKMPERSRAMRPIAATADYIAERRHDVRQALRHHVPLHILRKSR